ncbi:MAG: Phosphoglycerate kinase [Candidatus Woesebacteria bacterium GW2011_GWB1_45_5]|uniref:phosphoglycerate kinase n=1 Tax=Candidatus Woesebacteria bacterium GW2011_GWB1_45_5 TaxID=1618581 RepID=A0A0G1PXL8_9BACT|nr:MAG: Phosphoglycerate kinase [Candidatus Woesebacteria bacterium GW2011_GWB1_45_5]
MKLPKLTDIEVSGKKVLVRMDLDIPKGDDTRLEAGSETLDYLKSKNADIVVIGHRGRPDGKVDENLSLKSLQPFFDKWGARLEENLRFDPGEEKNDPEFAKKLASFGDTYINEAFAASHREHASIVGLPKLLPHAAGLRFVKEVENLSKVFENPQKPVVILISGIKEDKVEMAKKLSGFYDKVLVGGRLPEYFGDEGLVSVRSRRENEKLVIGNLVMDKEDITLHTIERFKTEIKKAGTLVLAGVPGKYEDEGHRQGTKEVFEAVAGSPAYKVAGGGDTEAALSILKLTGKFDWISVGGGAMLEFLSSKTLPGIEALIS